MADPREVRVRSDWVVRIQKQTHESINRLREHYHKEYEVEGLSMGAVIDILVQEELESLGI